MDRLALKDVFRGAVAQRESETNEAEHFIDLTDNQAVCNSESCGVVWKPLPINSNIGDEPSNS